MQFLVCAEAAAVFTRSILDCCWCPRGISLVCLGFCQSVKGLKGVRDGEKLWECKVLTWLQQSYNAGSQEKASAWEYLPTVTPVPPGMQKEAFAPKSGLSVSAATVDGFQRFLCWLAVFNAHPWQRRNL